MSEEKHVSIPLRCPLETVTLIKLLHPFTTHQDGGLGDVDGECQAGKKILPNGSLLWPRTPSRDSKKTTEDKHNISPYCLCGLQASGTLGSLICHKVAALKTCFQPKYPLQQQRQEPRSQDQQDQQDHN